MNTTVAAVFSLSLQTMPPDVIAAANNGLTGFGKIGPGNVAYQAFRDAELIKEDGTA